jgi:hypothetical protein
MKWLDNITSFFRRRKVGDKVEKEPTSPFFFKHNDKGFKIYLDIRDKTFIVKLEDDYLNILNKSYSKLAEQESSNTIAKDMVAACLKSCNDAIMKEFNLDKSSSLLINNRLMIFIEPIDFVKCENFIYKASDIVYEKFDIFYLNINNINNVLNLHDIIGKKLEKNKEQILERVRRKYKKEIAK